MIIMNKADMEFLFYKVIKEKTSINDFEKWLYNADENLIDSSFGDGFYFELLNINYRNKSAQEELEKIIYSKIPFSKFEEMTLRFILNNLIDRTQDKVEVLKILYRLYCSGYYFLRFLGLIYILYGIDELPKLSEKALWDEHDFIRKREILDELSSKLETEAKRILGFLNNRLIIITDEFEYDDLRTDEDKIELNNLEQMYKE